MTRHQTRTTPRNQAAEGAFWLYGLHAARAALANPRRKIRRASLTERAKLELGRPSPTRNSKPSA